MYFTDSTELRFLQAPQMSLDGFLTFLTLVVAIYSFASPVARLRLRLGMGGQLPLALIAFTLVIYLELFQTLSLPCPMLLGSVCERLEFTNETTLTPPQVAFLVVIIWMVMAFSIHFSSRLGPKSLPAMSRLVDELSHERRFADLLTFITPNLNLIDRAARRKLPLQKLHDWLLKLGGFGFASIADLLAEHEKNKLNRGEKMERLVSVVKKGIGRFAALVPAQHGRENAANNICRTLFRSEELRRYIVELRPQAAIPLLGVEHYEKYDFSKAFFGDLIADVGGALYQELKNNDQLEGAGFYFPPQNRILHFLFSDVRIAEKLQVWKPVGDCALYVLRDDAPEDLINRLNGRPDNFEVERWDDPLFGSICFFDLMVTTAAVKGVEWHMWLYYFPLFVERLEEIYDVSNPSVSEEDEFPTRSARLIYEMFRAMGDWVGISTKLPASSPHLRVLEGFGLHNDNIPASASIALGRCLRTVIMSERIGIKFAAYMHDVVMMDIKGIWRGANVDHIRAFFIQAVVHGGDGQLDENYGQRLATFFSMTDHILRHDVSDYKKALQHAYPKVYFG
jgi:hypothetical protein